tara:strand:+ start:305 stop:1006 length:702 start_codon:yes stop_codon:yes gene_type:complete
MTTKAEAVNSILRRLGKFDQAEANTAQPYDETKEGATGTSTASYAERFLDTCNRSTQSQGWYFNTEYDVEVTPDGSTKKIALPTTIGGAVHDHVEDILNIDTWGADAFKNVIIKHATTGTGEAGTPYLFDLDDNTFEFDSSIKVVYTYLCRFDLIPEAFVDYMVAKSAFEFNAAFSINPPIQTVLAQEVQRTDALMKRANNQQEDFNVLETQEALAIRGRTGYTSRRRGTRFP